MTIAQTANLLEAAVTYLRAAPNEHHTNEALVLALESIEDAMRARGITRTQPKPPEPESEMAEPQLAEPNASQQTKAELLAKMTNPEEIARILDA
ncbi:MAG: hypothetical protein OXG15_07115 [Gammaproteobacteria bacterium]|nr:hypothetical protein [Gammaproteobacteria bacterium]